MIKEVIFEGSVFQLKIELVTGSGPTYTKYLSISNNKTAEVIIFQEMNVKSLNDIHLHTLKERIKEAVMICISRVSQNDRLQEWDGKL